MKIVITGITGLLGTALMEHLQNTHEIIGLCKDSVCPFHRTVQADLTDWHATYQAVTKINPDLVIHTAAEANVDACQKDPAHAYRVNALGTRNIAVACQRFDAALLYISTDYVFSGEQAPLAGYTEFDATAPASVYGASKWQGEEFVRAVLGRHFIVRTSWLFGKRRANFVSQVLDMAGAGKPYTAVTDMVSSPTYVNDLAEAIGRLIGTPLYGTYHLSNAGFGSRYDIAEKIVAMAGGPRGVVQKTSLAALDLPAPRPRFSALRNYAWELNGFLPLRPWQEAVAAYMKERS